MTAPMQPGYPQPAGYPEQPQAPMPQAPAPVPQPTAPPGYAPAQPQPPTTGAGGPATVNWKELMGNAGEGGFQPLPENDYDAVVHECVKTTSSAGKVQFKLKWRILAGPYASKIVFDTMTISPESPGALNFFFRGMAAIGLDANYFNADPPPDQVARDMLGRTARLRLKVKEFPAGSKQMRNDVDSIMPATPGMAQATGVAPQAAAPPPQQPMAPQPAPQPQPMAPAPAPVQPVPAPQAPPPAAPPGMPPVPGQAPY